MSVTRFLAAAGVLAILTVGMGCGARGGLSKGAAALDADTDGKISRTEFLARYQDKQKGMTLFQRLDANGDGFLDHNEAGAYPDDFWTKTETDAEP